MSRRQLWHKAVKQTIGRWRKTPDCCKAVPLQSYGFAVSQQKSFPIITSSVFETARMYHKTEKKQFNVKKKRFTLL